MSIRRIFSALFILVLTTAALAQKKRTVTPAPAAASVDYAKTFVGMQYRCIGPTRGGRSTAVAGIPSKPSTFFMGTTGGGVWRTDDSGITWNNVTDGQISVGSIGSVRVAHSDPNVVYVGTGSAEPRGNISPGKGMYRSTDGGKTWTAAGLEKGGQIGRIEIHPTNPEVVYAAVLGNLFGSNPERGVYRSKDGGKNWERVLFVNDKTGAIDLVMDPKNPRILYAAMWQVQRKPWTLVDGGPDGGVYQSRDGGDTWKKLEAGLPSGVLGRVGIAVSPANPDRVWVLAETPSDAEGGLFRSDDGGKSFRRINGDRELRTRHWYYTRIVADPKDPETVYVNNVSFRKSIDGGLNFTPIRVLHGDCHDLWINPDTPELMIHSNDGGAHITSNGGKSWSSITNQPTAEFYRVEVDNGFPYRVYGCQQDNSSISVSSAGRGSGHTPSDWLTWGGESGHVAVDPRDGIIYSGNYTGELYRFDVKRDHVRTVTHYPQLHDGLPMHQVKYRYQWNAPITISTHNPDVLYHASQYVHKTVNGGQSWEVISPDLTLNRKDLQELPGGPVQIDYTGVENFNTVFVLEESPLVQGELWAGTDDGLVHLTTDSGKTWNKITPPGLPELATVNSIDISHHHKGTAYVTAYNYRLNDFKPYVFRTDNYGVTWTSLTSGIPADWFVRVVREDPAKEGLLYCGTEFGMFISGDGGKNWTPFQLNLPRTPVTDLLIKDDDLVMSTQGRSFWILDDLTAVREWSASAQKESAVLFTPQPAYRTQLSGWGAGVPAPAPKGAVVQFMLDAKPDSARVLRVEITDAGGKVKKVFSSKPDISKQESEVKAAQGYNRLTWDLEFPAPEITPGSIMGYGWAPGPQAAPGKYIVKLSFGTASVTKELMVLKDPRWHATDQDLQQQFELSLKCREELSRIHRAIRQIRSIRTQVNAVAERAEKAGKPGDLRKQAEKISASLTALENLLTQTKHKAGQDPINYPPMFDEQWNWLCILVENQDALPTAGCYDLFKDLIALSDKHMSQLDRILQKEVETFNESASKLELPDVVTRGEK